MGRICVRLEVALRILLNMKEVGLWSAIVLLFVICWDKFNLLVCKDVVAKGCDFDNLCKEVLGKE